MRALCPPTSPETLCYEARMHGQACSWRGVGLIGSCLSAGDCASYPLVLDSEQMVACLNAHQCYILLLSLDPAL